VVAVYRRKWVIHIERITREKVQPCGLLWCHHKDARNSPALLPHNALIVCQLCSTLLRLRCHLVLAHSVAAYRLHR
jgi:hypothetical protein